MTNSSEEHGFLHWITSGYMSDTKRDRDRERQKTKIK